MTINEMITRIKTEARMTADNSLDDFIVSLIKNKTDDRARIFNYPELIVLGTAITLVDEQGEYSTPDDFLRLLNVYYSFDEEQWHPLDPLPNNYSKSYPSTRSPNWFSYSASKIRFWPSEYISASSDYARIDYIQKPSLLMTDLDEQFPIPSLEEKLILEIVARIGLYDNSERAAAYQKLSQTEIGSIVGLT